MSLTIFPVAVVVANFRVDLFSDSVFLVINPLSFVGALSFFFGVFLRVGIFTLTMSFLLTKSKRFCQLLFFIRHNLVWSIILIIITYTSKESANIDFTVRVVCAALTSKVSGRLVTVLLLVDEVVFGCFFGHDFL